MYTLHNAQDMHTQHFSYIDAKCSMWQDTRSSLPALSPPCCAERDDKAEADEGDPLF